MPTNLSTEQLWDLTATFSVTRHLLEWRGGTGSVCHDRDSPYLPPRYLASGFTTSPAFLEKRFDKTTFNGVGNFFLAGYVSVLLPCILYTGSKAIIGMFDLAIPIWVMVVALGLVEVHAIFEVSNPSLFPTLSMASVC